MTLAKSQGLGDRGFARRETGVILTRLKGLTLGPPMFPTTIIVFVCVEQEEVR